MKNRQFSNPVCDEGLRCEIFDISTSYCIGDFKNYGWKPIAQGIQEW